MRTERTGKLLGALALAVAVIGTAGCGTSPTDPDGCRSIEEARCRAAPGCSGFENLDVDACVRFYRDQCLHGMNVQQDPGQPNVDRCVEAIKAAGKCARAGQQTCDVGPISKGSNAADSCTAIAHPEKIAECAFLNPTEELPTPTGDAGSGDAASGADGNPTQDSAADSSDQ